MGGGVATSGTAPSAATRSGARSRATQNEWVTPMTAIPAYAPSMYSSPWAKFITPSSPKITVRPSARSPSAAPKTRPCMSCGSRTATRYSNSLERGATPLSRLPRVLVLLLDLPGEPFHGVSADHRLADRVGSGDARDRDVLAALDLVEVHVHHDLVVFFADALAADVRVVEAPPLVGLG